MANGIISIERENRNEVILEKLYSLWRTSVEHTHLFLSKNEIEKIGKFVPKALKEIPFLVVKNDSNQEPVAFMGISDRKLEMLFVFPDERGKGIGRELLEYGISEYRVNELCVNEQNPKAKGFYEYLGFRVYKRTPTDEQGSPYPLLYMKK